VFRRSTSASNGIGPLTIVGGSLAGTERFMNDPFRLPEETNDPQPTARLTRRRRTPTARRDDDRESFHFNALYGERRASTRA